MGEEEVRKTAEDICTTLVLFLMMSGYQELGNKGGGGERGEFLVFTALIIDNGAITELSIARPSVCTAGWAGEGSALCPSSVEHNSNGVTIAGLHFYNILVPQLLHSHSIVFL